MVTYLKILNTTAGVSKTPAAFFLFIAVHFPMPNHCKSAHSTPFSKHYTKGMMHLDNQNLAKQALDQIPKSNSNAR